MAKPKGAIAEGLVYEDPDAVLREELAFRELERQRVH